MNNTVIVSTHTAVTSCTQFSTNNMNARPQLYLSTSLEHAQIAVCLSEELHSIH